MLFDVLFCLVLVLQRGLELQKKSELWIGPISLLNEFSGPIPVFLSFQVPFQPCLKTG